MLCGDGRERRRAVSPDRNDRTIIDECVRTSRLTEISGVSVGCLSLWSDFWVVSGLFCCMVDVLSAEYLLVNVFAFASTPAMHASEARRSVVT